MSNHRRLTLKVRPLAAALCVAASTASLALLATHVHAQTATAGQVDTSQSVVLRSSEVSIAYPESSMPLALAPEPTEPQEKEEEAEIRLNPYRFAGPPTPDPVLQKSAPTVAMPAPIVNFTGQGTTNSPTTITGVPPDTNGAVGPSDYVQVVNGGVMIWNKTGGVLKASALIKTLWANYVGTNAGNHCKDQNDGDPVVLYDQLADRWFITQFSLPNFVNSVGPSFQCVAVSQTGDPAGAYYLYDYQYNVVINDYGKFGVWPDAYYAAFNGFGNVSYSGDIVCAYERAAMLNGLPARQDCFSLANTVFGLLPSSVDGSIPPPRGEPAFFMNLGTSTTLRLYKFHVDWTNTANSTFTGPTSITVTTYSMACGGGSCIPAPSPGNQLASLADRLMFRLVYRNFGTSESLLVNHTVSAGSSSGIRWYEIRSPNGTPVVLQQGTFAPDAKWRWMGSLAQDQAQDILVGYSISDATSTKPSVAWSGRLGTDALNSLTQGEAIVIAGSGVETGNFGSGQPAQRWGDYSAMTIDPVDDCTFWYTNEFYPTNGVSTWDTRIASVKFSTCAINDFSMGVSPSSRAIAPSSQVTFTVSTAVAAGTAESITLSVQDLPAGVTGSFVPPAVTTGASSTLTLTASAGAPMTGGPVTFTVIGTAASALHGKSSQVTVTSVVAPSAPTDVLATASSGTQVDLTWTAVGAADSYTVYRRAAGGSFQSLGSVATAGYSDTTVTADTAYLYKVAATNAGGTSPGSNIDLATTTIFTNSPLVPFTTTIQAIDVLQLRTAVNAVRALAGLGAGSFTNAIAAGSVIHSVDVTELRTALDAARSALSLPALTYANTAAPGTPVRAADIAELRDGVK